MENIALDLKRAILDDVGQVKPSEPTKNEVSDGKSEQSAESSLSSRVVLKKTVCYIVSAVIIENGKILMMQEAKNSCRGLWYLPAGRLEKNESLVEGAKREVLEETGLTFEPVSLICVESSYSNWWRFTFTGKVTGGKLKTSKEQDKESIEAGWYHPQDVFLQLPLRSRDICALIEKTLKWNEIKSMDSTFSTLPVTLPHGGMKFEVVLVSHDEVEMKILVDKESCSGFLEVNQDGKGFTLKGVVEFLIKRAHCGNSVDYTIHGVMRLEHVGKPHGVADGIGVTVLAATPSPSSVIGSRYHWLGLANHNLRFQLSHLIEKGCIELL